MSEKRKPSHDLERFKLIAGDPERLTITRKALISAAGLGFARDDIAATIRTMERRHFYKSMTSYADHRRWQDVYRVPSSRGLIYLKFTDDVLTEFILLSFKERDDG